MPGPRGSKPTLLLMVAAALLGAAVAAACFPAVRSWLWGPRTQAPQPIGVQAIGEVADLMQAEYVRTLETRDLLAGALEGVNKTLGEAGLEPVPDLPAGGEPTALRQAFEERFARAERAGAGKLSRSDLTYAALRGLVSVANDPYTNVMDPEQYRRMDEQMKGGNFGGVGLYIELDAKHSHRLTVVEPIESSPAAEAGVLPGDWITEIDGKSTTELPIEQAAAKIRGPVGTPVRITLKRAGREPFTVKLVRRQIHVKSASSEMLPDRIAYIRLRFFGDETRDEFDAALREVLDAGAQALVVDLRNNGGGYINAALDVASNFVQKGDLVVSVINPRTERNDPHRAAGSRHVDVPTVVLVNEYSASASEITAGALQDHNAARLLGKTTFGKASVQSIHLLQDGGALKYTVAHYLTPKGRDIHRDGIAPDIVVEAAPTNQLGDPDDRQLQAALSYLKKQLALRSAP